MFDLEKFNRPSPRYTSYPTAPAWENLDPSTYQEKLHNLNGPLSLYFHIPFCKTMCLYCGCSVVLNRKQENEELYVDYLCKEIDLVTAELGGRKKVSQLHFGGGTPTKLTMPLFRKLFEKITLAFDLDFDGEIALEIDPRTIDEEKLRFYRELGFNRVSFGVQDTNEKVQEAVKRRQSYAMTKLTFELARKISFRGINIDLIYGLPYQTVETFRLTVEHMIEMAPDRISLFSYAKVPWLKKHQNAIREETLPSTEAKFQIYQEAREAFVKAGYVAIGMDHFAKSEDELALCYKQKRLQRNFQGYSAKLAEQMIGFGVTAIGFAGGCYAQNIKDLPNYYASLDRNEIPVARGKVLTYDDHLRKWVIHTLMCQFELDKQAFFDRYQHSFDTYFADVGIGTLEKEGLVINTAEKLSVTKLGELLIRLVATAFDAYSFSSTKPIYSQSV
ncbi:MAG: Oxygen-independent coproporphyrinogen III oxidase [Chlamydiales bacterium]|nr:Oxygen-independent coproporphyrinogen III oxidase [Chlamydiales bacterium]MCH9619838.1 Oxygen-independent coproporphyrinogen III oxidase [Chlamydiales bacterium]MCH9622735.1 Oxygen-independent coproporphyrinogen III oxidase [Chlamydiales bacterium]